MANYVLALTKAVWTKFNGFCGQKLTDVFNIVFWTLIIFYQNNKKKTGNMNKCNKLRLNMLQYDGTHELMFFIWMQT